MMAMAQMIAARVCRVINDPAKREKCKELLVKILTQGDAVKDEVRREFQQHFSEEERRLIRQELERELNG